MIVHLLAVAGLGVAVAAWGMLMVRRVEDKRGIGVTELDGCKTCPSSETCSRAP